MHELPILTLTNRHDPPLTLAEIGQTKVFLTMRRLGGRIQRQVRRAFVAAPELTTAELLKWVYPRWAYLGGRRTINVWWTREEARRHAEARGD